MDELVTQVQALATRMNVKILEITLDEASYDRAMSKAYQLPEAIANISTVLEFRGPRGRITIRKKERNGDY